MNCTSYAVNEYIVFLDTPPIVYAADSSQFIDNRISDHIELLTNHIKKTGTTVSLMSAKQHR